MSTYDRPLDYFTPRAGQRPARGPGDAVGPVGLQAAANLNGREAEVRSSPEGGALSLFELPGTVSHDAGLCRFPRMANQSLHDIFGSACACRLKA